MRHEDALIGHAVLIVGNDLRQVDGLHHVAGLAVDVGVVDLFCIKDADVEVVGPAFGGAAADALTDIIVLVFH